MRSITIDTTPPSESSEPSLAQLLHDVADLLFKKAALANVRKFTVLGEWKNGVRGCNGEEQADEAEDEQTIAIKGIVSLLENMMQLETFKYV